MSDFAGVIIRDAYDRILVLYNKHKNPHWRIPGGKVEEGELPIDAAVRELREETGITVAREELQYCGENVINVDSGQWTGHLYTIRKNDRMKPRVMEPQTFATIGWYHLDDIEGMEPGSLTAAEIRKVYDVL